MWLHFYYMFFTKEKLKYKGEYTKFSIAPHIESTDPVLDDIRVALRTGNTRIINALKQSGIITDIQFAHNIIPFSGRNVLARILAGNTAYSGAIDYGALGNAFGPFFNNNSTELSNEVYRKQAQTRSYDNNITYVDWFFAASDVADQTFTEFGAFIDGTSTANSGRAWSLFATGGWVKNGAMFVSGKYTLI